MWRSLQRRHQSCSQTFSFATLKLLYARLTLTRFTTLYFFFAIITCAVLSAQQGLTFSENSAAVSAISSFITEESGHGGLVVLEKGVLEVCDGLPDQPGTNCSKIMTFGQNNNLTSRSLWDDVFIPHRKRYVGDTDQAEADIDPYFDISLNETLSPGGPCLLSLQWLDGIFRDAQREDVVTLLFQIWFFSLATITLLNESIPHLGAALLGHVLGAAWSCYRVSSTQSLRMLYQNQIVPEACDNHDLMGDWWDIRIRHAITIVVVNILTLFCFSYLSFRLFQVYANESFSRVGASPKVHRMYKLVLFFSVCLQLTGFFSVASTVLWLNKVCYGSMHHFTKHSNLYMATFIIMLVLGFPWVLLGWRSVRVESKIRFGVFSVLTVFLSALSSFLFSRPMYRYIFVSWPFFATLTVTAYVFNIASSILGVLCRLNFGKGLAHYLQVMGALAGVDFTAVHFSKGYDVEEKVGIFASELKTPALSNNSKSDPHRAFAIQIPALTYSQNFNAKTPENNANARTPGKRKQRGSSIYSEPNGMPILLTSSPPLVSEFGPAPTRLSKLSYFKSVSQKRPTMHERPTSRGGSGGWGDKTQRELDKAVRTLSPELPALPVLKSEQTAMLTPLPPLGPPGIERPVAAVMAPFSPIVFKQRPSSLSRYAPVNPPSPSPFASNPNSSLSSPLRLPLPPSPSAHSARSPSISSTWSIESPAETNLKKKKLQKLGMGAGAGLPSTPRRKNMK